MLHPEQVSRKIQNVYNVDEKQLNALAEQGPEIMICGFCTQFYLSFS